MVVLCRVCLLSNGGKQYHSLLSVFPEFSETSLCVLDLLTIVTSSKVPFTETYPNHICCDCYTSLKQAYDFIILFQTSQASLKQDDDQNVYIIEEDCLSGSCEDICNEEDDSIFEEEIFIVTDDAIEQEDDAELNYSSKNNEDKIDSDDRDNNDLDSDSENAFDVTYRNSKNLVNRENVIIVSIEDVLKEDRELQLESSKKLNIIGTQGDISKSSTDKQEDSETEETSEQDSNVQVMSVEDVMNSDYPNAQKILSVDDVRKIRKRNKKVKMKIEKEQNVYVCDICDTKYDSLQKLGTHQKHVHNPEWQEKFKCNKCGEQCRTVSAFRHHMRKHEGKKYACDKCEKIYLTSTMLKDHIRRVHEQLLESKFLCPKCGKSFKFKNALDYHMHIHTNVRDFVCRFCAFKTVTAAALKRHERIHTGERPYNCRYCDKTFAGSAERQKHEFGHKGIYPYQCKYCSKPFIQTYNMRVHWLQHPGPYRCKMCGKGFIDIDVLKFHYAYAHKIKSIVKKNAK